MDGDMVLSAIPLSMTTNGGEEYAASTYASDMHAALDNEAFENVQCSTPTKSPYT